MANKAWPFAEVIDFQEGPGILAKDFREEGVPLVRLAGLDVGASVLNGCNYLDLEMVAKKWSHFALKEGDILLSTSASLGRIAVVGSEGVGAIAYTGLIRMRPRDQRVFAPFIRYLLASSDFQHQVEAAGVGSVIKHFGPMHLKGMSVQLPSTEEQRAIAHILGTLDDKIELNRRMNETLEAIARAMFKSWFVDFDPVRAKMNGESSESICQRLGLTPDLLSLFPDRLVDSELGEIPVGWDIGAFHNCCERIESGGTPSRSVAEYWNGSIPWLTSGEVRDVIVLDTKEKITIAGLNASSAKIWPRGTTVVAMYGATAGQVCLLAEEMTANQACCALISKPEFISFVFLTARAAISRLSDKASGSAQQNLNKSLVANHQMVLPPLKIAMAFEKVASCLIEKWISSQREGTTLAALRDSLLPKLLSGELCVSEADSNVEACA